MSTLNEYKSRVVRGPSVSLYLSVTRRHLLCTDGKVDTRLQGRLSVGPIGEGKIPVSWACPGLLNSTRKTRFRKLHTPIHDRDRKSDSNCVYCAEGCIRFEVESRLRNLILLFK